MRTSMLAATGLDSSDPWPGPRRWVGRLYALHLLVDQQFAPMAGIDLAEVRRHCWRAIRQTLFRDAAALGVIVAVAWLAPLGTLLLVSVLAAIFAFAGKVKVTSPFVIAAAAGLVLALIAGGPQGDDPFAYPLLALLACFLIYAADTFWAIRRMRAVLTTKPGPAPAQTSAAGLSDPNNLTAADRIKMLLSQDPADLVSQLSSQVAGSAARPPRQRVKALYAKDAILGAGTPLQKATITVAVNKPQKGETITPFTASGLLDQIASHIESQGTVGQVPDGYASRHVVIDGQEVTLDLPAPLPNGSHRPGTASTQAHESFTHGLPELDVTEVVAIPVGRVRKRPLWWKVVCYVCAATWRAVRRRADRGDADEVPDFSPSPSAFPARYYVRASTTTWDGELIASVYVGAALQGHYLRLIIRPYLLAPIAPPLRRAEHLANRGVLVQLFAAVNGTMQACFRKARTAHQVSHRKPRTKKEHQKETGLLSPRERYALDYPDDIHHDEDADRILDVMELKVFKVVEDFLDEHHVNTEDFKQQSQVFIEKSMVITGGQNSGNFSVGNNNTQQSPGGSASGQGQGSGK
jgi:hypothetical protein